MILGLIGTNAAFAVNDIVTIGTGQDWMLKNIFDGNKDAYDVARLLTGIVSVGYMQLGFDNAALDEKTGKRRGVQFEKLGGASKNIRIATEADDESMQDLYKKYNASPSRNVASTKGNIDGESIELESVSGKINQSNPNHKGNFTNTNENHYPSSNGRLYDSEQKMIENLREAYKTILMLWEK